MQSALHVVDIEGDDNLTDASLASQHNKVCLVRSACPSGALCMYYRSRLHILQMKNGCFSSALTVHVVDMAGDRTSELRDVQIMSHDTATHCNTLHDT